MLHFYSLHEVELANAWVTIGMFDGVHRGHQAILSPLAAEAHAAHCPAVVITFYPHPSVTLRGVEGPLYLSTPEERAALLGEQGIDAVITLTFDRALASMPAAQFMALAKRHLGLRQLWVGFDFALGRNREGDIPALRRLGEEMGYTVHVTPEVMVDAARASSSQIRALVKEGRVEQANRLLGRPYSVSGPVIHGDGRGRTIGIPTANVDYWPAKIMPANGVYATWAWVNGRRYPSVSNIGTRPTFDGVGLRLEAYLLEGGQDFYGQEMRIEFLEFLRPDERFDSVQALIDQINRDVEKAKEVLEHAP